MLRVREPLRLSSTCASAARIAALEVKLARTSSRAVAAVAEATAKVAAKVEAAKKAAAATRVTSQDRETIPLARV